MPLVPLTGSAAILMEALRVERVAQADAERAVDRFLRACTPLSTDERQGQFDQLLGVLEESPTGPACYLAVVCGALLERGAWPGRMGEIVHRRLEEILPKAADLAREHRKLEEAQVSSLPITSSDLTQDEEERIKRWSFKLFNEACKANPAAQEAWDLFEVFWPACVAVFSCDVAARIRARVFLPVLAPLVDRHEGAFWLCKLLPVLDQEPIVVLDPAKSLGFTAKMSGVVDNLQLQALLMDTFPRGWGEGRRVSAKALAVVTGAGPQHIPEKIRGCWNLYQASALGSDGTLRSLDDVANRWTWGEGVPTDIEVVDGHRVVLLGPPSHVDRWSVSRCFKALKAGLDEVRVLDKPEVQQWVQRLMGESDS